MAVLKSLLNLFLFCVYALFAIVFWNFLYGWYVAEIQGKIVPGPSDPVHLKMAVFSVCIVFIATFLLRKYLYVEVFSEKFLEDGYKEKKEKSYKKIEEELEIYVNKEV